MNKLFFANVVKSYDGKGYILDREFIVDVPNDWDGDIISFLKIKYNEYLQYGYITYDTKYTLSEPLDRNGIKGDNEVFCEFDDGDVWSMTLYYTKKE